MFIFSRKVGDSLMIGKDIIVTIMEIKGNEVRVGIDAPDHAAVSREEIYRRIHDGDELAEKQGNLFRQP